MTAGAPRPRPAGLLEQVAGALEWRLVRSCVGTLVAAAGPLDHVVVVPAGMGRLARRIRARGCRVTGVDSLPCEAVAADCVVSVRPLRELTPGGAARALREVRAVAGTGAVVFFARESRLWARLRRPGSRPGTGALTAGAARALAEAAGFRVVACRGLAGPFAATHALVLVSVAGGDGARSRPAAVGTSAARRVRVYLRTRAEREPRVGVPVLRAWRALKARRRREQLRRYGSVAGWSAGAADTLSVDPAAIVHCSRVEYGLHDFRGVVVPGDWDAPGKRFADLDLHQAMLQVLGERSRTWEQTAWYAAAMRSLAEGGRPKGLWDKAEVDAHLSRLERLYAAVRDDGYLSQPELLERDPAAATGDEVAVAVGRGGELLFCDGAHRLSIALLLGLDSIPVQVAVRHPAWAALRDELFAYAASEGGRLYQAALHPDLAAVPSAHGCEDRWALIEPRLRGRQGAVLDIGANLGFFANRLEDLGYACTAVENDPLLVRFMTAIRDANAHHFRVVSESVLSPGVLEGQRFGTVLALNILHHFLKTKSETELLERHLRELRCDEMFFEPHGPGERQFAGAYLPLDPEAFTDFVASRTGLGVVEPLGTAADGRVVYHLRREG